MRPYEVMVIFDVEHDEADIREQVERVAELVRARGGTPGRVDYWGRRTLAYEVKHRGEGYYVLVEANAEPATMAEVDRLLALEDSVLRHKVLRQEEGAAGRRPVTRPSAEPATAAGRVDRRPPRATSRGKPTASEPRSAPTTNEPAPNAASAG